MAEHFFPSFGGIMSSSWQHFFVGSLQVACSATATSNKIKSVVFLTMDKLFFLPHSTFETHLLRNYHRINVSCTVYIMAIRTGCRVFKWGYTKLERFLAKNQHTQRKLLNWCSGELSKIRHHIRK